MTTLSATDARNRFFELIDRCYYKNEKFLVTKNGRPATILQRYTERDAKKRDNQKKR